MEYSAQYWVMAPRIEKVHYHSPEVSIVDIFGPLLDDAENILSALLDHTNLPTFTMGYFLWAAPLLKHQGFRPDHLHSLDAAHPRMSANLRLGSCESKLRKPLR